LDRYRLLRIQEQVRSGEISPLEASVVFQDLQTEDLGYASVDHHRALRLGFPEVIFGEGKTVEQIRGIFNSLRARQDIVSITRVDDEKGARLMQQAPELPHNRLARTLLYTAREPEIRGRGTVLVVYAGSSDLPVAEEAKVTAYALGNRGDSSAHIG